MRGASRGDRPKRLRSGPGRRRRPAPDRAPAGHERVGGAADEGTRGRVDLDDRRVADPHGEVPDIIAAKLVGLELYGPRYPPPVLRRDMDGDLVDTVCTAACRGRNGAARQCAADECHAVCRRVAGAEYGCDDFAVRGPARGTHRDPRDGMIRWGRSTGGEHHSGGVSDIDGMRPRRGLAVGRERDDARGQSGRPHERRGALDGAREVARTGEGLRRRQGARGPDLAVGGHEPHAVAGRRAVDQSPRRGLQPVEDGPTLLDRRRTQGVIEHHGQRHRRMPRAEEVREPPSPSRPLPHQSRAAPPRAPAGRPPRRAAA